MRILFWLVLFVVVILALKKKVQTVASPAREQQAAPPPSAGNSSRDAEAMVCCAVCQVYIPASEAVRKGQQVYCCEEHAEQAGAH